jgi:hemerythrin
MDSFEWSDSFITGIDIVDQQHSHLVELVNRFGECLASNQIDSGDLARVMGELTTYAEEHFRDEENLMRESAIDPRHFELHLQVHHRFQDDVVSMIGELANQPQTTPRRVLDFLIHWLAYHILGMDQNMARQIKYLKQGIDPAVAFEKS